MDFNKTNCRHAFQCGTTLIELSVVIAVLLVLVGVLFLGVVAWKNGASAAMCITNLSSIQKAARGYQSVNGLSTGSGETSGQLLNASFWASTPICPGGGVYTMSTTVPGPGVAYARCSLGTTMGHVPSATAILNW
jgi:prepilin-type N-terminal cleavage/methylation domain-containing protein